MADQYMASEMMKMEPIQHTPYIIPRGSLKVQTISDTYELANGGPAVVKKVEKKNINTPSGAIYVHEEQPKVTTYKPPKNVQQQYPELEGIDKAGEVIVLESEIKPGDIKVGSGFIRKFGAIEEPKESPKEELNNSPIEESVEHVVKEGPVEDPKETKMDQDNNKMDDSVKRTIIKIIAKDMKQRIIRRMKLKNELITEQKVMNELRNWYWNVGFVDVIVHDRDVILKVSRPNKFIGRDNYLYQLREVLDKCGFKLELRKAPETLIYQAFFGII
jgi:hypothetical protein